MASMIQACHEIVKPRTGMALGENDSDLIQLEADCWFGLPFAKVT